MLKMSLGGWGCSLGISFSFYDFSVLGGGVTRGRHIAIEHTTL